MVMVNPSWQKRRKPKMVLAERHARIARLYEIVRLLTNERLTVKEIAKRLDINQRTAYRYLNTIEFLDLPIEKGFDEKFFITSCECPICKREITTH